LSVLIFRMESLKISIFGNLINIHSEDSTEDAYKQNIFNYLENLKYQNDFNKLKEISANLDALKSKK
jgi:hypothetical protein